MTMFLVMLAILVGGAAVVGTLMLLFGVMLAVALGMAVALLVKVAPLLLLIWLAYRLLGGGRRRERALSAADRAWLEGP